MYLVALLEPQEEELEESNHVGFDKQKLLALLKKNIFSLYSKRRQFTKYTKKVTNTFLKVIQNKNAQSRYGFNQREQELSERKIINK